MTTVVRAEGVSKRFRIYHERNQSLKIALMRGRRAKYDEFWALQDVSFEIQQGTTFGLVGHNGSGKSTMLKTLAKILVPDRGRVGVDGKVSALLELGAGFHPELSGRDNVYLNGSILGLRKSEIDARFDEIVGFAGLEQFIDTPVKNYSSGMYVRLGFSVAINVEPDILMVDEVLAVGDEEFQRKCMEKFKDFRDQGRTIVVVSHALGTMRDMCDEVAWLDHGRLQGIGKPSEIVDGYVESTHTEREVTSTPDGGTRHGSGEVRVDAVEVLGPDGPGSVRTGDPFAVRLHWSATADVPDVVLGIGMHTITGQHVTGPNTKDAGLRVDALAGEKGTVELSVDRLMLLPGTYEISTGVVDSSMAHSFDHQTRAARFDVMPGEPSERLGVVSLGGTWTRGER